MSTTRRRLLGATVGSIAATTALGAFAGTAAAWKQRTIEFKGCSEVWVVVSQSDLRDGSDPAATWPAVSMVVVSLPGGGTECRELLATHQNATMIPGQHGYSGVLKLQVNAGEKVLGVITYNRKDPNVYDWADRHDYPSCYAKNEHVCATNGDAPAFESADCVQAAMQHGFYECPDVSGTGPQGPQGPPGGPPGQGGDSDEKGGRGRRGPPGRRSRPSSIGEWLFGGR